MLLKVILRELSLNVAHLLNSYIVPVIALDQWFSTGVLQEFLTHAIPDCVVRGTDLFSLRLSKKKKKKRKQPTHQYSSSMNESKLYLFFVGAAKNTFFGVSQNFSNQFVCHKLEKVETHSCR